MGICNKFKGYVINSYDFELQGSENQVLPLTWLVALTTVQHYRADWWVRLAINDTELGTERVQAYTR